MLISKEWLSEYVNIEQSVEALAQQQQTINYEVLCNLSRRLPRLYQYEDHTRINNELLK